MRVAIDLRQYTLSDTGGTTYAVGLLEFLPRVLNHEFVFIVNKATEAFARKCVGDTSKIVVEDPACLRPRSPVALGRRIIHDVAPWSRHIVDSLAVDLAHFPGDRFTPWRVETPAVLTFFGANHFVLPNHVYWSSKWAQSLAKKNVIRSLRKARAILVPSVFVKSVLVNQVGLDERDIFVRELVSWASGIEGEQATAPATMAQQDHFLLFTSSHVTYKNHHRLLGGYALLPKSIRQRFPLVITGRSPVGFHERISELGLEPFVKHLGFVSREELVWLYAHASAYVHPSLYEAGGSFSMFEAAFCKTPVISSRLNSMLEMMPDAIHFDPYNENSIAETLLEFCGLPDTSDIANRCYDRVKGFQLIDSLKVVADAYSHAASDGVA